MNRHTNKWIYVLLVFAYLNASYATIDRVITGFSAGSHRDGTIIASETQKNQVHSNMTRKHARMIREFSQGPVLGCLGSIGTANVLDKRQDFISSIQLLITDKWIAIAFSDPSPPFLT